MIVTVLQDPALFPRVSADAGQGRWVAVGPRGEQWRRGRPEAPASGAFPAQDRIIADTMRVMGDMAALNGHRRLWWATDLASKNRVTSPFALLLEPLCRVIGALEAAREQGSNVTLLDVPGPVLEMLRHAAADGSFTLAVEGGDNPLLVRLRGRCAATRDFLRETARCAAHVIKTRRVFRAAPSPRPTHLIKSFVYTSSFGPDGGYADAFFGRLAPFLQHRAPPGAQVVTVALGFIGKFDCYRRLNQVKGTTVVPLEAFLHLSDVAAAFTAAVLELLFRPFRVPARLEFLGFDIAPLMRTLLASGGWYIQPLQLLHFAAGRRLARTYPVASLTTTCEGNPWEYQLIAGLRAAVPGLPVTGYQHSVVPYAAMAMFKDEREFALQPAADRLLTVGNITTAMVHRFSKAPPTWVSAACALRYEYLFAMQTLSRRNGRPFRVLVALEGLVETADLLSFALEQAANCPQVEFRLRTHPVLPLDALLAMLDRHDIPANAIPSTAARVTDDVAECDAVLYWGTTVSVEAIFQGRPVIHYARREAISSDPLYDLDTFRWVVADGGDLGGILRDIQHLDDGEYDRRRRQARGFVENYFLAVDDGALEKFLSPPGGGEVGACSADARSGTMPPPHARDER